ncbi:MAG: NADH-quinone oxidoreductase subunit J [Deltaproteobacteria bacterium]|jgi:NADH-quinone oxidoreductase subunit J|nr:NADH-quinone oxidoreductase subunit J [Deltaproteobacteria bacterium]
MYQILFYILAVLAVSGAFGMITRKNPIVSVAFLTISMVSIAGLFALLSAPFLAVLQLMISAGAVIVLFVFVIMIVDYRREESRRRVIQFGRVLGSAAVIYLVIVLALSILKPPFIAAPLTGEAFEMPETLGRLLISEFMIPFELTGVLLLSAAVAVILMVKRGEGERDT